ncbi:MAG: PAQR family membrane homeostasis protein TrhA [Bdellovibrionota bacterium]|jgi:hemolysin III
MKRTPLKDRVLPGYTKEEEIFNMTSHIVGGAFAIIALIMCIAVASWKHNVWGIVSGAIYGSTLVILYTMSSIYHGLKSSTAKKVFQVIDHCAIFLLIAGTYTPILLNSFREAHPGFAWSLFGVNWGMVLIGVTLNAIDISKYRKLSLACYIGMGWCIVVAAGPMVKVFPPAALILLLLGGIVYTIGAGFYAVGRRRKYMHSIFHIFVLAGSVLHFCCILLYVL